MFWWKEGEWYPVLRVDGLADGDTGRCSNLLTSLGAEAGSSCRPRGDPVQEVDGDADSDILSGRNRPGNNSAWLEGLLVNAGIGSDPRTKSFRFAVFSTVPS